MAVRVRFPSGAHEPPFQVTERAVFFYVHLGKGEERNLLLIPSLIHKVVGGVGVGFGLDGFGTVLDFAGWDACVDAGLKYLIGWDHCTGCDDGSVWHDCVVHHDSTHSYDHIVSDDAAVNIGAMTDRYIVTDYAL